MSSPAIESRSYAIRCAVYESLKHGDEKYARELLRESCLRVPKTAFSAELCAMEMEGELTSRIVPASEHGENQYARRYYKRAWPDVGDRVPDPYARAWRAIGRPGQRSLLDSLRHDVQGLRDLREPDADDHAERLRRAHNALAELAGLGDEVLP